MKQDQLDYFRKRLLETKDRLLNEIAVLEEATEELNQDAEFGVSNHMADDATDIYEREKNFALIEDRKGLIDQVDAALERIEQGTYGICIKSGQQIPLERLEVLPYAATTVGVH